MVRQSRRDEPGSWHHVFNRAIARRTMFERRSDFRHFLALLACSVRRREVEVHAFALMGTHFHLLLRSLDGRLANAMHRIQMGYSRHFNRTRRRDGPLVRGRYRSKPVLSLRYRRVLVGYIDRNPVAAGLAADPSAYPYGSAGHYLRERGPRWLERGWIEEEVRERSGSDRFHPASYASVFSATLDASIERWVAARMASVAVGDPLDDLVGSAPGRVLDWMRHKARIADGTAPGLALLPEAALQRVAAERASGAWRILSGRSERDAWPVARIGLSRDLCESSLADLAARERMSIPTVSRLDALHRRLLNEDAAYASRIEELARLALAFWSDR